MPATENRSGGAAVMRASPSLEVIGSDALRTSRAARPQEVYSAAVHHLEQTLVSNGGQGNGDGVRRASLPAHLKKRASHEGFRPGALSSLVDAKKSTAVSVDVGQLRKSSSTARADPTQRNQNRETTDPGRQSIEDAAVATNRSLALPVTEGKPLGQAIPEPVVSPIAVHGPAAVSRNLTHSAADRNRSDAVSSSTSSSSRPPSSRLRYQTPGDVQQPNQQKYIYRKDKGDITVPSGRAAAALRRSGNSAPSSAAADGEATAGRGNELMSYLERLNSTLQKGGGADDILATSLDAGGPPTLRRRPAIVLGSRPGSARGAKDDTSTRTSPSQPEASTVSRAQHLLAQTSISSETPVSSPKGPFSKSAQLLVDALRSKDDRRLQEVLTQLRSFSTSDDEVKGLNDCHAVTGRSALHEAVMLNRLTSVQILLQAGADPNVAHVTQGVPLLHAAAWGETALVEALILCGSDINAVDCAEYTALHYAAVGDHEDTIRVLLDNGARLDAINDEGRSPLDLAATESTQAMLRAEACSPARPISSGGHKASPRDVQAALDRLRVATPDSSVVASPPSSNSGSAIYGIDNGSPASISSPSPGGVEHYHSAEPPRRAFRPMLKTSKLSEMHLTDMIARHTDRHSAPETVTGIGSRGESDDGFTPPLLLDVSPTASPTYQPSSPRGPHPAASDGLAGLALERLNTPPVPLMYGRAESKLSEGSPESSRPSSSRPNSGMYDVSGRSINQHAAEAAAKAAAAVGRPVTGLNTMANQMFYQSVEVQTGDITWTRGELIGEGAYGKVYCGLNQLSGELMAVKVLPLNVGNSNNAEERMHLEGLERELSMYRKFKHRHIVGYIAAHMDFKSNTMYMFLEFVPGGSMASMLERFGAFSEELTRKYTRELLMGLEYLHGCKVIHRDLKGGNVLVTRNGRVKLTDFGASKAYHEATITDGMKSIRGSVFWMAPEVIKGTGYGRRADIWSVGCTVLEMMTANHPWPNLDNHWSAMFHIAKAKDGPPLPATLSAVCRDFLQCCFQVDAHKRPTATELLQHPFVSQIPNALREAEMARGLNHSL